MTQARPKEIRPRSRARAPAGLGNAAGLGRSPRILSSAPRGPRGARGARPTLTDRISSAFIFHCKIKLTCRRGPRGARGRPGAVPGEAAGLKRPPRVPSALQIDPRQTVVWPPGLRPLTRSDSGWRAGGFSGGDTRP